jgi:hypothetical protein
LAEGQANLGNGPQLSTDDQPRRFERLRILRRHGGSGSRNRAG